MVAGCTADAGCSALFGDLGVVYHWPAQREWAGWGSVGSDSIRLMARIR